MDVLANFATRLEEIGLTKHESQVYLALLSLETATAYQIAQHCEVKKPTVYITLEDLRLKGLVLKVPHAKKALFAARSLDEYLREQENKLQQVKHILPQLDALSSQAKPNVYFFTGLRGVTEAINYKFDRMEGKVFKSFYGNLADCGEEIKHLYARWDKRTIDTGTSFQIIMAKEQSDEYYKDTVALSKIESRMQIRYLEQYLYPSNISFEIGSDFIRMIDSKNLYATIIDDQNAADAMRQIFDIVWEKGV